MPAPKKYTQHIFDDICNPYLHDPYGDLGSLFSLFKELADIRQKRRLSQHDLSKKSGLTQPVIARIEAGRANPTLLQLIKLARALGHRIKLEPAVFDDNSDYEGYLE